MLRHAVSIRQDLLSPNSVISLQTAQTLGYRDPHIELVAITSALQLDCKLGHLRADTVIELIEAIFRHQEDLPHYTGPAKEDLHEKFKDARAVAVTWALRHPEDQRVWTALRDQIHAFDGPPIHEPTSKKKTVLHILTHLILRPASREALLAQ